MGTPSGLSNQRGDAQFDCGADVGVAINKF